MVSAYLIPDGENNWVAYVFREATAGGFMPDPLMVPRKWTPVQALVHEGAIETWLKENCSQVLVRRSSPTTIVIRDLTDHQSLLFRLRWSARIAR